MNKDFSADKLQEKSIQGQFKVLYDLARFIESGNYDTESEHFKKLAKYHLFLADSSHASMQKLHKEFHKIKNIDRQFQVYLMNLERFLGQSKKDYEFLVELGDKAKTAHSFPVICLLDSVRSAHNVGAMMRNAECFGTQEVILCGLTPTPELAQVKKTAMGSDQMIKWRYAENAQSTVEELKQQGYQVWSVETAKQAHDINQTQNLPPKLVLIFGHEQHGISLELLELSDKLIKIPLYGNKNSLNVSICQGIILNQICAYSQL